MYSGSSRALIRIGKLANFSGLFTGETRELSGMMMFLDNYTFSARSLSERQTTQLGMPNRFL